MTKLDETQIDVLKRHRIPLSAVFDATGLGRSDCRSAMKELDKEVAIGVTPCGRRGHTLRTRSGHCLQCNPAAIAFQRRHSQYGYVYVVGSFRKKIIKIGSCSNPENRSSSLNEHGYGGASDWTLLYYAKVTAAGDVEYRAHNLLALYAAPTAYLRNRIAVDCLETFFCGASMAIEAIKNLSSNSEYSWRAADLDRFEFKEIEGGVFRRARATSREGKAAPLVRSKRKPLDADTKIYEENLDEPIDVTEMSRTQRGARSVKSLGKRKISAATKRKTNANAKGRSRTNTNGLNK